MRHQLLKSKPNNNWNTGFSVGLWVLGLMMALWLVLERHAAHKTFLFDLGYYTQVIWNTANGHWFANSLKGPTFLTDHFSLILVFLAPLFWVAPDARTLLGVHAVALFVSFIPAYLILRRNHPSLTPFFALGFLLNLLLHETLLQEFHEIVLAVPCLCLALYGLWKEKKLLLVIGIGLLLLVREDMGIYAVSLGLYLLVIKPLWRWLGIGLIVAGSLWTLTTAFIIMPQLGSGEYRHLNSDLSTSQWVTLVTQSPFSALLQLLTVQRLQAVVKLLVPLAFIPILSRKHFFLWLPGVLFLLILPRSPQGALNDWYVAPLLPLLWFSLADWLAAQTLQTSRWGVLAILLGSIIGYGLWGPLWGGGAYRPDEFTRLPRHAIGLQILKTLPENVEVIAQTHLGAHVATRAALKLFPWFEKQNHPQYIVLDEQTKSFYPLQTQAELVQAIRALQIDPQVAIWQENDGYYIFRLNQVPRYKAINQVWGDSLQLEGYAVVQTDSSGFFQETSGLLQASQTIRVDLIWKKKIDLAQNYSISVLALAPDGYILAQHDGWPAQGTLPTSQWIVGQTIRDWHYLHLPDSLPEKIRLAVVVYDSNSLERLSPTEAVTLTELSTTP